MSDLQRDLRFGFRILVKNPTFAAVAILALALGIGANTAIFSVVYATLLAPMPYPHPERVVAVWSRINGHRNGVSAGDFLDWKQQSTAFQELDAVTGDSFNLSASDEPEQVIGVRASPGFISHVFGIPPLLGRDFLPEEGEIGRDHEVILTHRLWVRRFSSDDKVIGTKTRINGEPYTVVGVMPAGVYDRYFFQMFVPLAFKPEQVNHDFHWLFGVGRLKPGFSLAQARNDMDSVTKHIAEVYPKSNKNWGADVEPYQNVFLGDDIRKALWLLLGAVGLVLLIACANVANLQLVRGLARQKEVAIRASVGATPGRLFTQFLAESLALAAIGGIVGMALGWAILKLLESSMPPFSLPPEADIKASLPVLGFALAVTTLSGVLCGCAPAWHALRLNLNDALKEGGQASRSSVHHRLGRALVIVECALTLTLLAAAGLLVHGFWNMRHADLGIRTDHVLTFDLPVPTDRFSQPAEMVAFYRQLLAAVEALPGINAAAVSTGRPVQGTGFGMPISIAGKPDKDLASRQGAGFQMVTPEFYKTFGIRLVKGRVFTEQDVNGAVPVAMVNESFVKKFLSGVDPLTQRVIVEQLIPGVTKLGPPIEWQVVGVFHDIKYGGFTSNQGDNAEIEVPFWQSPWPGSNIAVRTGGDPAAITKSLTAAIRSVDSTLPLANIKTMDQVVDESLQTNRVEVGLLLSLPASRCF